MTVAQIAEIAAAEAERRPGLEELRRRMDEMRRDASLLKLDLPEGELIEIVARADENFSWMIANDPDPARAARAEAELLAWKARMMPLLDRLGRGQG